MQLQSLVNPVLQLEHILKSPFNFLAAFYNSLYKDNFYLDSMVAIFGWFNFSYMLIVYYLYFAVFGFTIRELVSYKKIIFPKYAIIALVIICFTTFLLPFILMYIFWTPVGYPQILGVQGRYFLVIFPFVILIMHQLFARADQKKIKLVLVATFFFFVSLQSMTTIYTRFFKEIPKENDIASMIKFEPTKVKLLEINKKIPFIFETKSEKKEVSGFKFNFTTRNQNINTPYSYQLMDESCTKTYREGELDIGRLKGESLYEENFLPFQTTVTRICLTIEPKTFSAGDNYISIIAYNDQLQIGLLDNLK